MRAAGAAGSRRWIVFGARRSAIYREWRRQRPDWESSSTDDDSRAVARVRIETCETPHPTRFTGQALLNPRRSTPSSPGRGANGVLRRISDDLLTLFFPKHEEVFAGDFLADPAGCRRCMVNFLPSTPLR
jgi:hypothetical protein